MKSEWSFKNFSQPFCCEQVFSVNFEKFLRTALFATGPVVASINWKILDPLIYKFQTTPSLQGFTHHFKVKVRRKIILKNQGTSFHTVQSLLVLIWGFILHGTSNLFTKNIHRVSDLFTKTIFPFNVIFIVKTYII